MQQCFSPLACPALSPSTLLKQISLQSIHFHANTTFVVDAFVLIILYITI